MHAVAKSDSAPQPPETPMSLAAESTRGEQLGRAYARDHRDIPPLNGGAFAVGFLYGYRSELRACGKADAVGRQCGHP